MRTECVVAVFLGSVLFLSGIQAESNRKLLQTGPISIGQPATITVSAANPLVNAITITLARPYPQNPYYCNVTGDNGIPQEGPFPLTVRVPVGVTSTVVFANITGSIPGTTCTGSSVVQQPGGTSVVQQPGGRSSIIQQPGGSSVVQQPGGIQLPALPSVVQQIPSLSTVIQQAAGGAVVQQQFATSINQQNPGANIYNNCVANSTSVVQQQTPSTVVQQQTPSSVVQQPGRHLLQAGTIEYISNNGSAGQPQLNVLDTVEGVPNISFRPTAAGQTAVFNGALQVAVTTTNDGFGTPYVPYRVDSRLSPQCAVQVNFVAI